MGGKLSTFFLFILLNIRHVSDDEEEEEEELQPEEGEEGGVAKSSLSSCQYFPP